jgi:hypothetical protein
LVHCGAVTGVEVQQQARSSSPAAAGIAQHCSTEAATETVTGASPWRLRPPGVRGSTSLWWVRNLLGAC